MDEVYKRICDKLGCEPKDIAIPEFDTEDDSWESPFKVLTNEELNQFKSSDAGISLEVL